jgi:peptidyl-prolyl cis-trans isomerase SurA
LLGGAATAQQPSAAAALEIDRVAAVVNDDIITISDIYELGRDEILAAARAKANDPAAARAAVRELELEVLDVLIMRRLIRQEIVRLNLDVTDEELGRAIEDVAKRNKLSTEQLRMAVAQQGVGWDQYRDEMREGLREAKFSQAVIQPRVTISDDELLAAYKEQAASASAPAERDVGAVCFKVAGPDGLAAAQARAAAAAAQITGPDSLIAMAGAVDECGTGGSLGTFQIGQLPVDAERALLEAGLGKPTPPVQIKDRVFVLMTVAQRAAAIAPFEELREQLMDQVYGQRAQDEMDLWYRSQRRQAAVEIKLEVPGGLGAL